MAITRTGSIIEFHAVVDGANSGTESVTVPADAEIMIVGVVGYITGVSPFSGGSMTIAGAAMTYIGGDADVSKMTGGMFYKVSPATGSQTLAWDWAGTSTMEGGTHFVYAFYKGINTGVAIRHTNATQQSNSPHTSGTLTAQSGDLIVAYSWQFVGGSNATFTWTGATEQAAFTNLGQVDDSWAEASPSGNQTVSTSVSIDSDGGIGAIVLIPAGGGGGRTTKNTRTTHLGVEIGMDWRSQL